MVAAAGLAVRAGLDGDIRHGRGLRRAGLERRAGARSRRRIIGLFALNGFLNILWSDLFFRLHRPDWALAEVGFLWLSILLLIVTVAPASRKAAWLLAPYLAWVAFAAVLNAAVVRLNYPF